MVKRSKPQPAKQTNTTQPLYDSDEDSSFTNWLRSESGVEYMKMFILFNTIIVVLAMAWPHIKEALNVLFYMYKSISN